ncbi:MULTISPECIES: DUF4865 family protein [Rhizobium]|uniref:DUF4865 domain-containing protein n=1 Tax=Rhizobium paranaense TaxID=1650438 RepID=A0A7W9D0M3_9HYPH|nr:MULTISPECIES: DUF4865 family protein [Rhizobium]MBB5572931.1 hypothetical protein [Rhizobium paranaense]PST61990.1 DUF4865 domain-containing protein [Rhizobium sp. SEMIA4064]
MIAMQYSFTLPADYDMAILDRRIRDKGPMLDNFPGLKFKAYLSARKGDARTGSRENLYSPFYVWDKDEGLSNFICGPGFAGVTESFGRPQVKTWIVWRADISPDIQNARFAIREIFQTGPYAPLAEIRQRESDDATGEVARGEALASVAAFEPTSWTRVRFRLLADLPKDVLRPGVQIYDVGHLSLSDVG